MNRIENISQKLNKLKDLDKRFSVFGSSLHQYQFNNTLSKQAIHEIEKDNTISLSNEYKTILNKLGNGGAGSGYGLEKLSLKNINPPFIGTKQLLRNWNDPNNIDCDMVDLDEISGYIKLFDYGCGMEYCLIVNGEEIGDLIFFDCDGRFEKLENNSVFNIYEKWLDYNLSTLNRIKNKLEKLPLQEVIDTEWEIENFLIEDMILSIMGAQPLTGSQTGNNKKIHLEKEYIKWLSNTQKTTSKWWQIWRT